MHYMSSADLPHLSSMTVHDIRAIDLFCGAGGSSWGARLAGVEIVAGFDAWAVAAEAFSINFPEAMVFHGPVEDLATSSVRKAVGAVDLILASPECTSHSIARGRAARSKRSRDTAFQVVRFAEALQPRWVVVENVVSMRAWSRYGTFKAALEALGYNIREQVLNAADFGVPQRRRRLFLLCDKESLPGNVEGTTDARKQVSTVIDMNGAHPLSALRTERRAPATLARAQRAMDVIGSNRPFLIVYYGSDKSGGWQRLSEPLRTITTLDRFALVRRRKGVHVMRMLQVPELKRAMGMPKSFSLGTGTRREQIRLIGNAVCPPVTRAIIRLLLRNEPGREGLGRQARRRIPVR
jgi:DNA (cytosine-5)-methyltransferase 1